MASEYAKNIVAELESASQLRAAGFFITRRPWLDLYGVNVRPVGPFGSTYSKPVVDASLIHRCLPDELLFEIFARMTPYNLGKAACVCRKWRNTVRNPVFWRNACLKAWQISGVVENYKLMQNNYDSSWRKMWLSRPRVRMDGIYVSRNTYIRAGVAEWKVTNPVHVVCYFRYLRFYPSGRFLYKNSSEKLKDVVKFMNFRSTKAEICHSGRFTMSEDKVEGALLYPGMRPTIWRIRLSRLRGTTAGANNRMDLLSIVTSGVQESEVPGPDGDILGVVEGWQDDETHNPEVPAISHTRGLTPFVFVPFEEAETSVLNLPVERMDYYVPGEHFFLKERNPTVEQVRRSISSKPAAGPVVMVKVRLCRRHRRQNLTAARTWEANLPSFNASTSSSSSSFNSSPPDFLRNVQAAFKRHRMMPELNNLQPRRLVAPRREISKSLGLVIDSKTDESHDVSVKQDAQDSRMLMKNTMTVTTVNYESASITPPSISDMPTEEGKFMSIDVQRGQYGFSCDCRGENMVESCLKCRHNIHLDGPKRVQFAMGNNTRSYEIEHGVNNQPDVLTAPNHDVNEHNFNNQVNPLGNFLQNDFGHQVTSSSVVGSTCAITVNSVNAPMLNSTTRNSQPSQMGMGDPSRYNNKLSADQNLEKKCELSSDYQVKELGSGGILKDPPLVDKLTKGDILADYNMDAESRPPITNDRTSEVKPVTSKSAKIEKPASKKDASASRRRNYDPDLFFKVNGKLYQRLGKIGSGGSSEVHKVISQDCTIYALKKIKLKGRDYSTAYGFCQEIEYLNKLKGKDHIIQLIDYEVTDKALLKEVMSGCMSNKDGRVKDDGCIYMVLEYGEIDLARMLSQKWKELDDSRSTIDENWLRFYWQQILLAVKTIHEERIVHSDLKPANFLLVRGSLKLIDFGIAKAIMSDTTNIQRDSQVSSLPLSINSVVKWDGNMESGME
ncbi:hypothetical protein E3N88_25463 [Mikania micrantha]|uniref:Protein kinase domain-containing protein n=1 Tax=Mikania micrantha TaxID=192012 RepID=A0A5N6N4T3_9ASTR|nr:hypothetical protein E3N88_25463 [Mikania micrantha]